MKRVTALLFAGLVLAGCGDTATAKYRSGAEVVGADFRAGAAPALSRLRAAPSTSAKTAAVSDFKAVVDRARHDFARLKPPQAAKSDHRALVNAFGRLSGDLNRYRAALADGEPFLTRTLANSVEQDFRAIESVSTRLNRDVGA